MAIAFESLVKLIAYLAVGAFAIFGVFGSFEGLNEWLISRQDLVQTLKETDYLSSFHMMTLCSSLHLSRCRICFMSPLVK